MAAVASLESETELQRDLDRLSAALRRVGDNEIQRVRWLLTFAQSDLGSVDRPRWDALLEDLEVLPFWEGFNVPSISGLGDQGNTARPTEAQAIRIQNMVGEWILGIVGGKIVPLSLEGPLRYLLRSDERWLTARYCAVGFQASVSMAAWGLLNEHQLAIRKCRDCPKVFVRVGRQWYCGSQCSQRTRTRQYWGSHREELNEKQRERYAAKARRRGKTAAHSGDSLKLQLESGAITGASKS
jgi:hypothetical protein